MNLLDILRNITQRERLQFYDNKSYIAMWEAWYRGKVADFHNYKIFTGKTHVPMQRFTLGMAKKACEDWANLLINEKTDITLSDNASQETLNSVLRKCNFWQKANEGIEKTFAVGIGAWVVSVENMAVDETGDIILKDSEPKINVSFVYGDNVYPITIEDGEITECAFTRIDTENTYITAHLRGEQGYYQIHNIVAKNNKDGSLTYEDEDYFIFNTQAQMPWFICLKPNIANNIKPDSPLGISIFANAIDNLKSIDLIYDSYANEFVLGRKRIFVNARTWAVDTTTGEQTQVFDSNDVAIYVLPESDDGSMFMQDNTQTLRVSDHELALQNQLNLFSYACGFGTNHYKYDAGGVATATQIVSENSDMFRNIRKHEILIESALIKLVNAIIYAVNTFTNEYIDKNVNIEIKFDDSIIEDKQAQMANDRLDVSMGVMSKAEYRSKWYNEDIETAEQNIEAIDPFVIPDTSEETLGAENQF